MKTPARRLLIENSSAIEHKVDKNIWIDLQIPREKSTFQFKSKQKGCNLEIRLKFQKKKKIIKMSNSRVEILKDCRFYLEKFELCNNTWPRFGSITIPSIVKNMLSICPMLITLVCLVRFVIISGFNLDTASGTFAISLGITQLALIYISLAVNRKITFDTMIQMQNLVDYRKWCSIKSVKWFK